MNGSISYHCNLPPFFPPTLQIPAAVNSIQACIAVLSAVISLPLNFFLFIIIVKFPVLHQRSLYLSLQIILVEILYHLLIPATILISTIHGEWIFGRVACNITGMIHDGFAMYRFTMTFVFTVDRFISVHKPFFRHGASIAWILTAFVWLVTLIRVILPLSGILDCYTYISTFKTCTAYPGCSNSCGYFVGWSVGVVVLTGVVLPLCLYIVIFFIVRRIIRYHQSTQDSIRKGRSEHQENKIILVYNSVIQNRKKFVTLFILLISIAGTTPAFTLYIASVFHQEPNTVLFIVNMLVGRTSFNFIPVFDSLAFMRHQDINEISSKLFRKLKCKITSDSRNQYSEKPSSISLESQVESL